MIKGCDYQQADIAGRIFIIALVFFASIGVCVAVNYVVQIYSQFMDWYARVDGQQPNSRKEQQ